MLTEQRAAHGAEHEDQSDAPGDLRIHFIEFFGQLGHGERNGEKIKCIPGPPGKANKKEHPLLEVEQCEHLEGIGSLVHRRLQGGDPCRHIVRDALRGGTSGCFVILDLLVAPFHVGHRDGWPARGWMMRLEIGVDQGVGMEEALRPLELCASGVHTAAAATSCTLDSSTPTDRPTDRPEEHFHCRVPKRGERRSSFHAPA